MTDALQPRQKTNGRFVRLGRWFVSGLGAALDRFPAAVVGLGAIALVANMAVADMDFGNPDTLLRLMLALSCGAAASVSAALFAESRGSRFAVRQATAAVAFAVVGLLVWLGFEAFLFAPPLVAALICLVPLAPHLRRSTPSRFWLFTIWTVFGVALGFVSVMLFVLGLSAILEMIRYLFDVGLGSRAYSHIWTTAASFVGPLFALGRIPRDFDEEPIADDRRDPFASGLAVLLDWVVSPLVLAAAVVLHLYAAKIIATGEVPRNQIGWIVTTFALFVLAQRIAAHPFLAAGGVATRVFGRVWAGILIVPLVLLGFAVWSRVSQQGFTVERYYLALATLAVAAILIAQVVPRLRGDIRLIAAVPLALLVLSSLGPLGAKEIVRRSQLGFIERNFAPDGMLLANDLAGDRREELRSRINALHEVEAVDAVVPLLAAEGRAVVGFEIEGNGDVRQAILTQLRLDYGSTSVETRSFASALSTGFDVGGFDLVFASIYRQAGQGQASGTGIADRLAVTLNESRLDLRLNGVGDTASLTEVVRRAASLPASSDADTQSPLVFDGRTENGRSVRILVRTITYRADTSAIEEVALEIALRRAEWSAPAASLGGDGQR